VYPVIAKQEPQISDLANPADMPEFHLEIFLFPETSRLASPVCHTQQPDPVETQPSDPLELVSGKSSSIAGALTGKVHLIDARVDWYSAG
jgi:hypothetical protein